MVCYRLKHIPSGLYFCPSRTIQMMINGKKYYPKSNLGKKGKVYTNKPSLQWVEHGFYNHLNFTPEEWYHSGSKLSSYVNTDWRIEEV